MCRRLWPIAEEPLGLVVAPRACRRQRTGRIATKHAGESSADLNSPREHETGLRGDSDSRADAASISFVAAASAGPRCAARPWRASAEAAEASGRAAGRFSRPRWTPGHAEIIPFRRVL